MYIQFGEFYDILKKTLKPDYLKGASNKGNAIFDALFSSYLQSVEIHSTNVSKYIHNKREVPETVAPFYRENGVDLLVNDILDYVFPKLISIQLFEERLATAICFDCDLQRLLKAYNVKSCSRETDVSIARYIADVLLIILERPFIPAPNGSSQAPEWLDPNLNHYLISRKVPNPCNPFVGREAELKMIHDGLTQAHKVLVKGIHGIGKSELAYEYCKENGAEYRHVLYVDSTGNLKSDLCTLQMAGYMRCTGDMFQDVLYSLRGLHKDTLLVIDNLHPNTLQEDDFSKVLKCGCDLLITTRCNIQYPKVEDLPEVEAIGDMKKLIALVCTISGRNDLKEKTLKKIIKKLHGHTTAVVLLARLLQKNRCSLEEIAEKLNMRGLKGFVKEKLSFGNKKDSFQGHLRTLFGLFQFEGNQRYALQNMVLMPQSGIPLALFERWTGLEDTDIMDSLIDMGMVHTASDGDTDGYQYMVSLKPLIRELAAEELMPSIQTCGTLIQNTREAMHRLSDSHADLYLLQLSLEVIDWAEKDDLPTYIDYLHKSFELAARQNHADAMQRIADALAFVLAENKCGTNLDRALMQDYQAAVQTDNIIKAINYRKSALSQLDVDVLPEKQVAAEILDRIAGNYLEMYDFEKAKAFSDQSWKLFQELDMLGSTEVFTAACRRGVILCHAGEEVEGLGLLHQIEAYVKENESYPTHNRVVVQSALAEAYQIVGDDEKAKAYITLCEGSIAALHQRMQEQE